MAGRPKPPYKIKQCKIYHGDYARLCAALGFPAMQNESRPAVIKIYEPDHQKIHALAHTKAAQEYSQVTMPDMVHEILPAGKIPEPKTTPYSMAHIIQESLRQYKQQDIAV